MQYGAEAERARENLNGTIVEGRKIEVCCITISFYYICWFSLFFGAFGIIFFIISPLFIEKNQ